MVRNCAKRAGWTSCISMIRPCCTCNLPELQLTWDDSPEVGIRNFHLAAGNGVNPFRCATYAVTGTVMKADQVRFVIHALTGAGAGGPQH